MWPQYGLWCTFKYHHALRNHMLLFFTHMLLDSYFLVILMKHCLQYSNFSSAHGTLVGKMKTMWEAQWNESKIVIASYRITRWQKWIRILQKWCTQCIDDIQRKNGVDAFDRKTVRGSHNLLNGTRGTVVHLNYFTHCSNEVPTLLRQ